MTEETINLGYLVPSFPGQTHIFFYNELEALTELGINPILFSTTKPPANVISHSWSAKLMQETTYFGLPKPVSFVRGVFSLPWGTLVKEMRVSGRSFLVDVAVCISAAHDLKRHCKRQNIKHVHVHSCAKSAVITALAKLMGGPSYSLTLHGPLSFFGGAQGFKWRHAKFGTIITKALLEQAKQQLQNDLPEQVYIQPMGVNLGIMKRTKAYEAFDKSGALRLFSCGRLNEGKGHQDLVEAVYRLKADGWDIRAKIAGEDDDGGQGYRIALQNLIDEKNLQKEVELLGAVDTEKVRSEIEDAHIFVLPSRSEALGVAYMEAMACETPTIGSNTGGVPELIEDGVDGLLIEPRNIDEIMSAIKAIAEDPALAQRLSSAGRNKVVSSFTSDASAKTIADAVKMKSSRSLLN